MTRQLIEDITVVGLEDVATEEERQEKGKTLPHPAVKALDGYVHIMSLAQRLQAIKDTLLITELEILYQTFRE